MFFQTLPNSVGHTSPKPSYGGQNIRKETLTPVLMIRLVTFLLEFLLVYCKCKKYKETMCIKQDAV